MAVFIGTLSLYGTIGTIATQGGPVKEATSRIWVMWYRYMTSIAVPWGAGGRFSRMTSPTTFTSSRDEPVPSVTSTGTAVMLGQAVATPHPAAHREPTWHACHVGSRWAAGCGVATADRAPTMTATRVRGRRRA